MADKNPKQPAKRRVLDAELGTPSAASTSPDSSVVRPSTVSMQSGPWPNGEPQASPENSTRSRDYNPIYAPENPESPESSVVMHPVDQKADRTIRGQGGDYDANDVAPYPSAEPASDPFDIHSASSSSVRSSFPAQLPSSDSATALSAASYHISPSASADSAGLSSSSSVLSVMSAISGSSSPRKSAPSCSPRPTPKQLSSPRSLPSFKLKFPSVSKIVHKFKSWTRRLRQKKKHTSTPQATFVASPSCAVENTSSVPTPVPTSDPSAAAASPSAPPAPLTVDEKSPLAAIPEESLTLGSFTHSPTFSPKPATRESSDECSGQCDQVPEADLDDQRLDDENDIIARYQSPPLPTSTSPPLSFPTSAASSAPSSSPSSPGRPGETSDSSGEDQPEGGDPGSGITGMRTRTERMQFAVQQLAQKQSSDHQRKSSEGV